MPLKPLLAALLLGLALGAQPALAQTAPKIVKKVPMEFPSDAARRGVDKGVLKTRVTIDGGGAVTEVEVLDTQPVKAKILNAGVVDTLKGWRFEGSGKPLTFDMQVVLTAD
jgi:outer membrane biosynthesis protein TonB